MSAPEISEPKIGGLRRLLPHVDEATRLSACRAYGLIPPRTPSFGPSRSPERLPPQLVLPPAGFSGRSHGPGRVVGQPGIPSAMTLPCTTMLQHMNAEVTFGATRSRREQHGRAQAANNQGHLAPLAAFHSNIDDTMMDDGEAMSMAMMRAMEEYDDGCDHTGPPTSSSGSSGSQVDGSARQNRNFGDFKFSGEFAASPTLMSCLKDMMEGRHEQFY